MNFLKIFTYSGIIEVFLIPYILPCIVSMIPSNVTDMIELGIGIISGLFPRVTIDIESEVFFRMWKDLDGSSDITKQIQDRKDDDNEPSSSNMSPDSRSCSPGNRPSGESKPSQSQSKDGNQCWKPKPKDWMKDCKMERSDENKDSTTTRASESILPTISRKAFVPAQFYHPSSFVYTRKYEDSVRSSDKMDTFCRSCSAEYHVKPPEQETLRKGESLPAKQCPGCVAEELSNTEDSNPSFYKSCSVEYVSKLIPPDKKSKVEDEPESSEKLVHHTLLKSPVDYKLKVADRQVPAEWSFECKQIRDLDWEQKVLPDTHLNLVQPVYFGDNYKNL